MNLFLANGGTTIRSLGTTADEKEHKTVVDWRNEIADGRRFGPNICATCPPIIGFEKNPWELVHRYYDEGHDCVKLFSLLSQANFIKVIDAAKDKKCTLLGTFPPPLPWMAS